MAQNALDKLSFEIYRAGVPRINQRESIRWFKERIQKMKRRVSQDSVYEYMRASRNPITGSMFFFQYSAKTAKKLPYWDAFPCVIILGPSKTVKGGVLGLNLHYLPPALRAKFLGKLLDITNNRRFDETTKFEVTYGLLKDAANLKEFRPCLKLYLSGYVSGSFARVEPIDWAMAVFLPVANWQKRSAQKVYYDSNRLIRDF